MACFSMYDLTPISTTSGLWSTGNTRKYQQIDVYIYQCAYRDTINSKILIVIHKGGLWETV